jgi:hypothetical protein
MSEVYAFIEAEKTTHNVAVLCRLLKVARSSFYALAREITVLRIASRCTYGVQRIHAELRRLDRRVNRKRVERIMREYDITGVTRRKRRSLTRPAKKTVPAHDLIGLRCATRPAGRRGCAHGREVEATDVARGLGADLAQVIADLKPKFVRFPGGCLWNRSAAGHRPSAGPARAGVPAPAPASSVPVRAR